MGSARQGRGSKCLVDKKSHVRAFVGCVSRGGVSWPWQSRLECHQIVPLGGECVDRHSKFMVWVEQIHARTMRRMSLQESPPR